MKTKITLIIAILCISFSTKAQTKVGTIDSEFIIAKMPQLKMVQTRIESYGARLDSINNVKVNEYDVKVKTFNDGANTLVDSIKKKMYAEIGVLNQDIAKFRENGAKMMQLRRNDFMRPLYQKLTETIAIVAKEKGYTQIINVSSNSLA